MLSTREGGKPFCPLGACASVPMFIFCLLASVPLGQLMSNVKPSQALDSLPTTSRRSARARRQDSNKVPDCQSHHRVYSALTAGYEWGFCYPCKCSYVNTELWGAREFKPMSDCLLISKINFGVRYQCFSSVCLCSDRAICSSL